MYAGVPITAPVCVIVGMDLEFHERALSPLGTGAVTPAAGSVRAVIAGA